MAASYSYDPGNNAWSQLPAYPVAMAFPACGGVDAQVVCAGGSGASSSTYVYTPGAAGWVKKADMPNDAWGAATATANEQLEIIGGAIDNGSYVTSQGFAYDPMDNTWSALPIAGATVAICTMFDPQTGDCGPTTFTLKTRRPGIRRPGAALPGRAPAPQERLTPPSTARM